MTHFFKRNKLLGFSVLAIAGITVSIFVAPQGFYELIERYSISVRELFGTFYLWLGLGCVVFMLAIAFSKIGKIRLGRQRPEYKFWSWIAMLYSAGMGAGILLRAVQEPVFMQQHPPIASGNPADITALEYTFYQWGFTAWAFYVFFALVMGYYLFVRKKTVLLSSTFNVKKYGRFIKLIDLLTVLTTVIGIVAAIGLGTRQIEGGIKYYFELDNGYYTAFIFTFLIFVFSFISAYRGIDRGIKRLSNLNITVTVLLLVFIFVQSDISGILANFFMAGYHYILDFFPLSLALGKYNPGKSFLTTWTYYYWAFWLAWAPFTGIFIARISRGRTIRQMILGSLIVPSIGSFFWFSVFGTASFDIIHDMSAYNNEFGNVFSSIFVFLNHYPLAGITSVVTILLLVGFLVTSVDSAIFVLSMFTDKGRQQPKKSHRLIWAILMFLLTEAILILGSFTEAANVLTAMQKLLIITSLPFAFLTVLIGFRLVRDSLKNRY